MIRQGITWYNLETEIEVVYIDIYVTVPHRGLAQVY